MYFKLRIKCLLVYDRRKLSLTNLMMKFSVRISIDVFVCSLLIFTSHFTNTYICKHLK